MTGRRFGPYDLEDLLGRGGMGEVYRAVDTRKSRPVALKLLPAALSGDHEVEARFRREAEVAARLTDPHVIPIHDFGELHGRLFLDMRLVDGVDLARTLATGGALGPKRAVSIVAQVAGALDAAHDGGLVHRDVKPSNILLTGARPGADDFVYLIDFGIAAGATIGTRLTATGHAVGTTAYMAPERFAGGGDPDPRVDVYALGCVLHEMLTGEIAFDGASLPNLMYQHLHGPPPRPSSADGIPPAFDAVIAKALAKDPAQRYARAGDLADAARAVLEEPAPPRDAPRAGVSCAKQPQRVVPTRYGPPPSGRPAPPAYAPHHGPAPWPPRLGPPMVGVPPFIAAPPSGHPWRLATAIIALPLHLVWMVFCLAGAIGTSSDCSTSSAACAGGGVGFLALAATTSGFVAAILTITPRRRPYARYVTATWVLLLVAIVLLFVTAGLDGAFAES